MKGGLKQNRKKKKRNATLQRYIVTVDKFVRSKTAEDADNDDRLNYVQKKSRKELRKEKRKLKKANMKMYYECKKTNVLPLDDSKDSKTTADEQQTKKTIEKAKKLAKTQSKKSSTSAAATETSSDSKTSNKKGKKINKLQESRKMALMEANEEEDREIKKLERRLGLNRRKNKTSIPQSFVADGLDYILGALNSGSIGAGVWYDEDDDDEDNVNDMDTAGESFKKPDEGEVPEDDASDHSEEDMGSFDEDDEVVNEEDEEMEQEVNNSDASEVNDSDASEVNDSDASEVNDSEASESHNENGEEAEADIEHETSNSKSEYVPSTTGKYVPPHLRGSGDDKRKAELQKLKRIVKGLVNRLSEPNMASISSQLAGLYVSWSRKDMNDTLTEVLLAACVTPTLMPDRLLMEHILLVSILHYSIGLEVGAHFLETVVRNFDKLYKNQIEGKECDNLLAIIAHLYNFQVVHSVLIFDILKLLVKAFTERDIELVLFVLRNVGFALRKDDALALKELISEAQRKASDLGSKFQDQTRVRFMLETMLALKNNDMRKIPGYNPEPVEKLRKLQRTLVHNSAGSSDVKLRVSLDNLLAAEQVGRWWIVGSSWSGAPMISEQGPATTKQSTAGQFSDKVLELARKQRMNTEVRRNIFCVIMTSEDYLDAFEKLLRMGLKDKQEREIVHVVMDCCLQEKTFNAFYAVLGEKFCSHDRRFQMTFQFTLWDKFRELSNLTSTTFNNLVLLVSHFLQRKCLPLSILKAIEFGELDKPTVRFLRQLLTKILMETELEDLSNIFGRISGIPKLGMLREGLKLFISHFLLKNAPSQRPAEQAAMLSERAQVATKAMEAKEAKLKL